MPRRNPVDLGIAQHGTPTPSTSFELFRGGHAPDELRQEFLAHLDRRLPRPWFARLAARIVAQLRPRPAFSAEDCMRLAGKLWNCTDPLPEPYCDAIGLRRGSTFAQAARALRAAK